MGKLQFNKGVSSLMIWKYITFDKVKRWSWSVVRFVLMAGLSFVILYPILQKISTAIKHQSDLYSPIVIWIPENFTLENFISAMSIMNYWDTLLNTSILAAVTTILTTA